MKLIAQQRVYPDSVLMVSDVLSKEIGFVIPQKIAIDYRNLLKRTIPTMEEKIQLQKQIIEQDSVIKLEHNKEINLLKANLIDERQKSILTKELSDKFEQAYKGEKRKKTYWRLSTFGIAVISGVLLVID